MFCAGSMTENTVEELANRATVDWQTCFSATCSKETALAGSHAARRWAYTIE